MSTQFSEREYTHILHFLFILYFVLKTKCLQQRMVHLTHSYYMKPAEIDWSEISCFKYHLNRPSAEYTYFH